MIVASARFEKNSEEWEMFSSFWKLCQSFWIPEGNDEYWEQAIKAEDDFCKKYKGKNGFFARKLANALSDTLAEKEKERLKQNS